MPLLNNAKTTKSITPQWAISDTPNVFEVVSQQTSKGYTTISVDGSDTSFIFPLPDNGASFGVDYEWNGHEQGLLGRTLDNALSNGNKEALIDGLVNNNVGDIAKGAFSGAWQAVTGGLDDWKSYAAGMARNILGADNFATLGNKLGYAYNPNKALHFDGIDFKDFSLSFTFVPENSKIARSYVNALNNLKALAAPQKAGNGIFFKYPPFFEVSIYINSGQQIVKRPKSALTSWRVELPQKIAWHSDGIPSVWSLVLGFKEAVLGTSDIEQTYTFFKG